MHVIFKTEKEEWKHFPQAIASYQQCCNHQEGNYLTCTLANGTVESLPKGTQPDPGLWIEHDPTDPEGLTLLFHFQDNIRKLRYNIHAKGRGPLQFHLTLGVVFLLRPGELLLQYRCPLNISTMPAEVVIEMDPTTGKIKHAEACLGKSLLYFLVNERGNSLTVVTKNKDVLRASFQLDFQFWKMDDEEGIEKSMGTVAHLDPALWYQAMMQGCSLGHLIDYVFVSVLPCSPAGIVITEWYPTLPKKYLTQTFQAQIKALCGLHRFHGPWHDLPLEVLEFLVDKLWWLEHVKV